MRQQKVPATTSTTPLPSGAVGVITATTAEEREFNELRRELAARPVAPGCCRSAVQPSATGRSRREPSHYLFHDTDEERTRSWRQVKVLDHRRVEGLDIAIGDRISGWAFAHKQAVLNSNAALELGPVARTFSTPLRYALAVPILNGRTARRLALSPLTRASHSTATTDECWRVQRRCSRRPCQAAEL